MEADWDLHAVVRGCCSTTTSATTTPTTTTTTTSQLDNYNHHSQQKSTLHDNSIMDVFPDLYQPTTDNSIKQFLNNLYNPLQFSNLQNQPMCSQSLPVSPLSVLGGLQDPPYYQQKQQQVTQFQGKQQGLSVSRCTSSNAQSTTKFKKRKNQVKRVCQVPAEGTSTSSSDLWSWRKYGQKPIKGSPYPRGYYRCSTSKGCSARKQVERNRTDPNTLIITYTGEHSHPVPSQRTSTSTTTRNNKTTTTTDDVTNKPTPSSPISPSTTLSPVTEKTEENDTDDDVTGNDIFNGLCEFDTRDMFSDHMMLSSLCDNEFKSRELVG